MDTKQGYVLIVDDNEMNREVLSRRLERQGYTVAFAEDGQRALERIRAERYDLILLDIMMPKLNGYQVLEAMKTEGFLRHMPVIVISAVDELDSIVRCIELGAEDYLFKPFNPVLLKARISNVIQRQAILKASAAAASATGAALKQLLESARTDVTGLITDQNLTEIQRSTLTTLQNTLDRAMGLANQ